MEFVDCLSLALRFLGELELILSNNLCYFNFDRIFWYFDLCPVYMDLWSFSTKHAKIYILTQSPFFGDGRVCISQHQVIIIDYNFQFSIYINQIKNLTNLDCLPIIYIYEMCWGKCRKVVWRSAYNMHQKQWSVFYIDNIWFGLFLIYIQYLPHLLK